MKLFLPKLLHFVAGWQLFGRAGRSGARFLRRDGGCATAGQNDGGMSLGPYYLMIFCRCHFFSEVFLKLPLPDGDGLAIAFFLGNGRLLLSMLLLLFLAMSGLVGSTGTRGLAAVLAVFAARGAAGAIADDGAIGRDGADIVGLPAGVGGNVGEVAHADLVAVIVHDFLRGGNSLVVVVVARGTVEWEGLRVTVRPRNRVHEGKGGGRSVAGSVGSEGVRAGDAAGIRRVGSDGGGSVREGSGHLEALLERQGVARWPRTCT